METRHITLALPRGLLLRAKRITVERGTPLSALVTNLLAKFVHGEDRYHAIMTRALDRLAHPLDLGTCGRAAWTREELHRRGQAGS